jgi:hypothetical protein
MSQTSPVGLPHSGIEKSETTGTFNLFLTSDKIFNPFSRPIPSKLSGDDLQSLL